MSYIVLLEWDAAALVATVTAYLILVALLFARMRRFHAADFASLGEPSLFPDPSIAQGIAIVPYLLNRNYRTLPDSKFKRLAGAARLLFMAWVASYVVLVAILIAHLAGVPPLVGSCNDVGASVVNAPRGNELCSKPPKGRI